MLETEEQDEQRELGPSLQIEKKNNSETSFVKSNATLITNSESVDGISDSKLGSESSQISSDIEVISQRLTEQNNTTK